MARQYQLPAGWSVADIQGQNQEQTGIAPDGSIIVSAGGGYWGNLPGFVGKWYSTTSPASYNPLTGIVTLPDDAVVTGWPSDSGGMFSQIPVVGKVLDSAVSSASDFADKYGPAIVDTGLAAITAVALGAPELLNYGPAASGATDFATWYEAAKTVPVLAAPVTAAQTGAAAGLTASELQIAAGMDAYEAAYVPAVTAGFTAPAAVTLGAAAAATGAAAASSSSAGTAAAATTAAAASTLAKTAGGAIGTEIGKALTPAKPAPVTNQAPASAAASLLQQYMPLLLIVGIALVAFKHKR